jgi:hypothetical protein
MYCHVMSMHLLPVKMAVEPVSEMNEAGSPSAAQ